MQAASLPESLGRSPRQEPGGDVPYWGGGAAPGTRLRIPKLSLNPTEELPELILPRRATADDLAVNPLWKQRDRRGAREGSARDRGELLLQQVGEKSSVPEDAAGEQVLLVKCYGPAN